VAIEAAVAPPHRDTTFDPKGRLVALDQQTFVWI
jgi:hypothetical protein